MEAPVPRNAESLLRFCISLTDKNCVDLQIKINKYIQNETCADVSFLILLLESTNETVIQVIGENELRPFLKIPKTDELIDLALKSSNGMFMENIMFDTQIKDVLEENNVTSKNIYVLPIKTVQNEISLILILSGIKTFIKEELNITIENIFRCCLTLLMNTYYGEEEGRLKRQNQHLLLVARRFFSHLGDFDKLLREIMAEARQLTSAERCSLFLIDPDQGDLVAKVFDYGDKNIIENLTTEIRIRRGQGIAGHVAETGCLYNIKHAYSHPLFYRGLDEKTGFITRNILCFPICDETKIIGVAQLCNKLGGGYFSLHDEEIASAFSIYCGISIMHSIVYKKISDAQARTNILNEILMYHLKVSNQEVNRVLNCTNSHQFQQFSQLNFNCRSLSYDETPCYVLHMFNSLHLCKRFEIKNETLACFILHIQRGYRDVPYHNWMHAFSVAHFAYASICSFDLLAKQYLTDLECLVYLISCLSHDVDHRGTNNNFEIKQGSLLASLYSSKGSVMEHHHFSQAMCILNSEDCNILQGLSSSQYDKGLQLIRDCIISTDLANHFKQMPTYEKMIQTGYCKENSEHRLHLLTLLMTCADLCDQIKDWDCVKKIAGTVYTEFFHQGDVEKQHGESPQEMMDRERAVIPDLQIKFLENIVLPVYELLTKLFPDAQSCIDVIKLHINLWHEEKSIDIPKPDPSA